MSEDLKKRVARLEKDISQISLVNQRLGVLEGKVDLLTTSMTDFKISTSREMVRIATTLESYITSQKEACELKHKEVEEHLAEAPGVRDKVSALWFWRPIHWGITLLILGGCVGGFWWLLRV